MGDDRQYLGPDGEMHKDRRQPESCPYYCTKAEDAADKTLHKFFEIMGVDLGVPKEVERFRRGIRFGETMHTYTQRGMLTVISVIATGGTIVFFYGVAIKVVEIFAKLKGIPK